MTDLICAVGDALEEPVPRDSLEWDNAVYRWADDGKATMTVQLSVSKPAESTS